MKKLDINIVKNIIIDCGFYPLFEDDDYICNRSKLKVRCKCGKITYKSFDLIKRKETKTCSHCNDPKIGDRFGKLIIIKVIPSRISRGCKIVCRCDCGNIYGPCASSPITSKNTTSCGNCKLRKNGKFTSHTSLNLQIMIEDILQSKCEHNKYINGKCYDIVCDTFKFIIEYDSYYWHRIKRDLTKNETQANKIAKNNGYKILRIRSDGYELPTIKQLEDVFFNRFIHCNKWTITLNSWKLKEQNGA